MTTTIGELIARQKSVVNQLITRYNALSDDINAASTAGDLTRASAARSTRAPIEADLVAQRAKLAEYEKVGVEEQEYVRLANIITPEVRTAGTGDYTTTASGVRTNPREAAPGTFVRTTDKQPATVAREQRFADHPVAARMIEDVSQRDAQIIAQHGSLGQMVRAMTTTSGSAIVPTLWAANVIDRARNLSAVLQAGAQIVPMDAKIVQIGRLTADPTAAFRTEGSAITASDPSFDNVTLTAKTMSAEMIGSMEWFADSEPNGDALVENAIAQAIATQLDLVALYGGITAGAGTINLPAGNPTGILAALNAQAATSVLPSSGPATNGTTQTATTFWNEILDTVYTPKDYNEVPNALVWNSKAARLYSKAYDTTGQPLRAPSDVDTLQRYVSNQIPSYTQGTLTTATDVFVGDFTQLLIGQRMDVSIQILNERYADTGQIAIVAHWRGDIGLARPRAFSVFKAIKGA